ncbi:MAG: NAD(P)-dependent glycerol-3-phosphate dehydrogenase [Opitutaceae bacterium]|nr:NAD(P)-dependent glycerol-3-phosphate dehydrogenase [Opitutaceae bacterium]
MNICVIGAGAWGTAFALHLTHLAHSVTLVPRRFEHALALSSSRENVDYLPGFLLPHSLQVGHELKPVLMEADVVLLACPSHTIRAWCEKIAEVTESASRLQLFLSLSKGLEMETYLRPVEIMQEVLPQYTHGCLTGPTNAAEVAEGKPTAMVLSVTKETPFLSEVQAALSGPRLRVYLNHDPIGTELGGCLKNIYAIAAGCSDGLGLGDNSRAAMLTRALAEMVRLGVSLGAQPETFYGLSGFGDLVATCNAEWSRNRQFGLAVGQGENVSDLIQNRKTVVEGYRSTKSFHALCKEKGLQAPILEQVYQILYKEKAPGESITALMERELKKEA